MEWRLSAKTQGRTVGFFFFSPPSIVAGWLQRAVETMPQGIWQPVSLRKVQQGTRSDFGGHQSKPEKEEATGRRTRRCVQAREGAFVKTGREASVARTRRCVQAREGASAHAHEKGSAIS